MDWFLYDNGLRHEIVKMCVAKQFFLLFLVNQEKFLVVLAKSLKNVLEQVHF